MGILPRVGSGARWSAGWALPGCLAALLGMAAAFAGTEAGEGGPDFAAPQGHAVEMVWTEQSPALPEIHVEGRLYRDAATGERVERYFDADGAPLDDRAVKALGISAKRWNPVRRSQPTEFAPSGKKETEARPVPALAAGEAPQMVFPPKDAAALLAEDALDAGWAKGLVRIGVADDLVPAVEVGPGGATAGEWRVLADGTRMWALTLRSLDAVGQRVRVTGLRAEPGVDLVVYPSDRLGEAWAVTEAGWSPTCFGEALTVECRVAPQVTEFTPFALDGLVYLYLDPAAASAEKAGSCNIPAACEAGWATAAMSVGGLGKVSGAAALFCTGTLIADTVAETTMPYLLTANHCVGDVASAGNLEVYWLYQSDTCDGAAGALENVPRTTGGADILTTSSCLRGTDVSLLQLRGSVPEGIPYAGWSTESIAPGRATATIHHPSGDPKCISFGAVPARVDGERLMHEDRFHAVVWNRGTTERGSSGCPLFTGDGGLIIGQLYGGYASCEAPDEADYFGRFDRSYALVQPYLDPGKLNPPDEGEGEGQPEGEGEGEGEEEEDDGCCHLFKIANPANALAALLVVAVLALGAVIPGGRP
ncbi:MAG: trypsin-like peptidase domain-containing protein [Candidatus Hydrogenedentes bacterium]|nr:trypsin-like peptidase domain-containing protein [Candidatus Hydrogenedentota bacterium]